MNVPESQNRHAHKQAAARESGKKPKRKVSAGPWAWPAGETERIKLSEWLQCTACACPNANGWATVKRKICKRMGKNYECHIATKSQCQKHVHPSNVTKVFCVVVVAILPVARLWNLFLAHGYVCQCLSAWHRTNLRRTTRHEREKKIWRTE